MDCPDRHTKGTPNSECIDTFNNKEHEVKLPMTAATWCMYNKLDLKQGINSYPTVKTKSLMNVNISKNGAGVAS